MKWLQIVGLCIFLVNNAIGQNKIAQNNTTPKNSESVVATNAIKSNLEFVPLAPVLAYSNDFEKECLDIYTGDFNISTHPGITGQVLQTPHPYSASGCSVNKLILKNLYIT